MLFIRNKNKKQINFSELHEMPILFHVISFLKSLQVVNKKTKYMYYSRELKKIMKNDFQKFRIHLNVKPSKTMYTIFRTSQNELFYACKS